jgi:hypothetical protein
MTYISDEESKGEYAAQSLPRIPAPAWRNVSRDGMPPCDGETVFVGINAAGYACCFNLIDKRGWCVMRSPEARQDQMSALKWWRVLDRPDVSPLAGPEASLEQVMDAVADMHAAGVSTPEGSRNG